MTPNEKRQITDAIERRVLRALDTLCEQIEASGDAIEEAARNRPGLDHALEQILRVRAKARAWRKEKAHDH